MSSESKYGVNVQEERKNKKSGIRGCECIS